MGDVRAQRNQQRSRREGDVSKDLNRIAERPLLGNIGRAHEFKSKPGLGIVSDQRAF
jgi:hypothetical protein